MRRRSGAVRGKDKEGVAAAGFGGTHGIHNPLFTLYVRVFRVSLMN